MCVLFKGFILIFVDDLFVVRLHSACDQIFHALKTHVLVRVTGDLNSEGAGVSFLGRHIRRLGDSARIRSSTPIYPWHP